MDLSLDGGQRTEDKAKKKCTLVYVSCVKYKVGNLVPAVQVNKSLRNSEI